MDLRDKNNTVEGYQKTLDFKKKTISEDYKHIEELQNSLIQIHPSPNEKIIKNLLDSIYNETYYIFLIKYSVGNNISDIVDDYIKVIEAMVKTQRIIYYRQLLNILSVGILLDVKKNEFIKIAKLIKIDRSKNECLNDYLIDLLVNYKIPEWERTNKQVWWEKPYQAFEEIELLSKNNKSDAVIRLKKYLQKQWLPTNNSNSRGKYYHCGYWSFESGAIVKIFGLDDTLIKDLNYYPYDMVHWKK